MNRRDKKKPPRPGMQWSKKHHMWIDRDTRSPGRHQLDEDILRATEADRDRTEAALRQIRESKIKDLTLEKAASCQAEALLKSLIKSRKKTGLSQAEVARRMGVPQPAVVRLEAGQHSPTLTTLARYASAIGVQLLVSQPA